MTAGMQSLQKREASVKFKRQAPFMQRKDSRLEDRKEFRSRRKKEENRNSELRAAWLSKQRPLCLDEERTLEDGHYATLEARVDLGKLQDLQTAMSEAEEPGAATPDAYIERGDYQIDRLRNSDELKGLLAAPQSDIPCKARVLRVDDMTTPLATTSLDLTPTGLALKFPTLFSNTRLPPKILVTTSLSSSIHDEAQLISTLFPNSTYIRRSGHRHGNKYSLREICSFAFNRGYTAVILVREDLKTPTGLTIVHLPSGPTFQFTLTNWIEGRRLPGHGNPTNHYPELLLNNFKTPLGFLTARAFQLLFPSLPEFQGRQVITLHNQQDYIFVRRHRYVFRERRATENSIVGSDGTEMKGVEGVRAALQELGPRFTLKLRRVEKGVGRAGSKGPGATQWQWKARMEKDRKLLNL